MHNKISLTKTVSCICVAAIAVFGSTALAIADYNVKVRYNGNEIYFPDSKPFVDENNRTLVPVRFVAESMNIRVSWDEQEKKITLIRNNIKVDLHIGEKHAMVNGSRQELDTSAELYGDRTFVPLRFLSELMGTDIRWDGDNNTVLL